MTAVLSVDMMGDLKAESTVVLKVVLTDQS